MKKNLNKLNTPIIVCFLSIIVLLVILFALTSFFVYSSNNLSKQQQWTSGKDSFDKAYEIAASDKETPDKNLYIPNLVSLLGKNIDQAVPEIGHGSVLASSEDVSDPSISAVKKYTVNLSNESSSLKTGSSSVVAFTNKKGSITKVTFSCDIALLGYGKFGFVDIINNQHLVENSYKEAGLNLEIGNVVAPTNRASYTTYASDGTTAIKEVCDFSGSVYQDKKYYKWNSTVSYDYTIANTKGDLSETIRIISISVSY